MKVVKCEQFPYFRDELSHKEKGQHGQGKHAELPFIPTLSRRAPVEREDNKLLPVPRNPTTSIDDVIFTGNHANIFPGRKGVFAFSEIGRHNSRVQVDAMHQ